jgi:hypothetical protein
MVNISQTSFSTPNYKVAWGPAGWALYFFNINTVTELKFSCQLQLEIPLVPNDADIGVTSPSEIHMADILVIVKSYTCNKPWRLIGLWDIEAPIFCPEKWFTQMAVRVVSVMCRPPFTPQEDSWHSFLLEAERPQGQCSKDEVNWKKSNDLIGKRTHDLLVCSIVPQPTTLLHAPGINDGYKLKSIVYVFTPSHSQQGMLWVWLSPVTEMRTASCAQSSQ